MILFGIGEIDAKNTDRSRYDQCVLHDQINKVHICNFVAIFLFNLNIIDFDRYVFCRFTGLPVT